ncbi:MAG: cation-transporting P-type ATPase [Waltera sp.]
MFEKQNIQETVNELKSDAVKGLTDGEAFRRLQQNGRNEMKAARKRRKYSFFWSS